MYKKKVLTFSEDSRSTALACCHLIPVVGVEPTLRKEHDFESAMCDRTPPVL